MSKASAHVALYEFERCLEVASKIYASVRDDCIYNWESINEGIGAATAQKIVGLAFVGVMAGWEDFLQSSFLRYMTGGTASNGYAPRLRLGPCRSITHAKQVIGGSVNVTVAAKRMQWSEYRWVEDTAKIFFEGGEPYVFGDPLLKLRLETAFVIRNRIVHNSEQAKRRFKEYANKLVDEPAGAPLPKGFSPGRLLVYKGGTACFDEAWLSEKTTEWGDLFEAYMVMFYDVSGLIVSL
jgi:hypothetical protein